MSESEARLKIKAVAYAVAAALGWSRAVRLLNEIANELNSDAWKDDR